MALQLAAASIGASTAHAATSHASHTAPAAAATTSDQGAGSPDQDKPAADQDKPSADQDNPSANADTAHEPAATTVPEPPDNESIGDRWRRAQALTGTSKYAEAIALLTNIYDELALDPDAMAMRMRVQWALHHAHLGAYDLDGDRQHLFVARDLVRKYRDDTAAEEQERLDDANNKLEQLDAQIAGLAPEPVLVPERETEPAETPNEPREDKLEPVVVIQPDPHAGRPLIISGGVLAGVGLAGAGLMIAGLVASQNAVDKFRTEPENRRDARDSITRGNTLGISGGVLAGAFLITGGVLLTLGLRRRKAARVSPTVGRDQLGLAWSGRF